MSQEYIASRSLGDQSKKPCLKASLAEDIRLPATVEKREWRASPPSFGSLIWIFSIEYNMPTTGSWHNGPLNVVSWKAASKLSSNARESVDGSTL